MTNEQQGADVIRDAFEKDFFADAPIDISARNRSGDRYEFLIADNAWKTWKRAWQAARAQSPAAQKPLTIDQIKEIAIRAGCDLDFDDGAFIISFVREIEAAHGICVEKEAAP